MDETNVKDITINFNDGTRLLLNEENINLLLPEQREELDRLFYEIQDILKLKENE